MTPEPTPRVGKTATEKIAIPPLSHKAIAGCVAGFAEACTVLPLEVIKTQMQIAKYDSMLSCARHIVKSDGVAGLYSGFRPFALQTTGRTGIRFFSVTALQRAVDRLGIERGQSPLLWSGLTGFGAGVCEALFWTTPTERLKVLQQSRVGTRHDGKPPATLWNLLREQGVRGLYVGSAATTARQATSVCTRFAAYEQIKTAMMRLSGDDRLSGMGKLLAGGLAGAISVFINNPIDVVKSNLQAGVYKGGSLQCCAQIVRERGVAALWAGTVVRVPRVFISQAMQFYIVETATAS